MRGGARAFDAIAIRFFFRQLIAPFGEESPLIVKLIELQVVDGRIDRAINIWALNDRREKRANLSFAIWWIVWKIQVTPLDSSEKFHGNPSGKTARFSEIQRITVALASALRDTSKRVVSVQERGVVAKRRGTRKKGRTLTQSVYRYWEPASANAAAYQFFNSNSHCGEILCHKKIGAFSPFLGNIGPLSGNGCNAKRIHFNVPAFVISRPGILIRSGITIKIMCPHVPLILVHLSDANVIFDIIAFCEAIPEDISWDILLSFFLRLT